MKKTHKKILGFLGILTVVAVTAFAIFLPAPETQATSSVTDTITVRVVTEAPDVNISGFDNGEAIASPNQTFFAEFANVGTVHVMMNYEPFDGGPVGSYEIDTIDANWEPGKIQYNLHFIQSAI